MPKLDLSSVPFNKIKPKRCEFAANAGVIVMFLRPLDELGWDAWRVKTREYVAKYIDGGWYDANGIFQKDPEVFVLQGAPFPLPVQLNEDTLGRIAKIELMQDAPAQETYTLEDLVPIIKKEEEAWLLINLEIATIQASYKRGKAWPVPLETQMTTSSDTDSLA